MRRSTGILAVMVLVALLAGSVSAGDKCTDKKFGWNFGGYMKTDLIYDTNRITPGNYALYVPYYDGDDNSEFFLTARESRFAFDLWWKEADWNTKVYMEFDWQNAGGGENKAAPFLRHLYMKFGKCSWSVLAGQYWDIISPLNPKTANYSVLWYQGNIGYRRAQLRFSTWTGMGESGKVMLDAGLFRNITANRWDVEGADQDEPGMVEDGADSGLPMVQGRVGFATKVGEEGSLKFGFSGHIGRETYGPDDADEIDTWSFNTDLAFKLSKKITVMGEFYTGENMGQFLGGIGQNTNPVGDALPSMGWWAMLSLNPTERLCLNLGYGMDDPDEEEWTVPGDGEGYELRDLNSELFGNVFLTVNKNITAIFEVGLMKTEYLTRTDDGTDVTDLGEDFDALRFQFALKCAI